MKNGAYAFLILSVCLWASTGTMSTIAMNYGVSVINLTALAFIFASAVFVPLVAVFDRKSLKISRRDLPAFIVFSLVAGVLLDLGFFGAINETTVAIAIMLSFTYPSIVTIVSVFIFKEKLTTQKIVALPMTFLGCALVAGSPALEGGLAVSWAAVGLGILAAVGTATYYLWGKKLEERYRTNTVALYLFVLSAIMLVFIANPMSLLRSSIPTDAYIVIFLMAVLPGVVGYYASLAALKRIEASKASIVSSFEPAAAVVIAFVVLSEGLTAIQCAGVFLTVVGVVFLGLGKG